MSYPRYTSSKPVSKKFKALSSRQSSCTGLSQTIVPTSIDHLQAIKEFLITKIDASIKIKELPSLTKKGKLCFAQSLFVSVVPYMGSNSLLLKDILMLKSKPDSDPNDIIPLKFVIVFHL